MNQPTLFPPETDAAIVAAMTLEQRVERAIALLKKHEPEDGYYLAFSGGKDSCAIKKLAQLSGVKFEAWYNQTTIDPPELVRFIKQEHADVFWNLPEHGNMMSRIQYNGMPTRFVRWCCREYKEQGGIGRVCIFGVRAAESVKRKLRWREVSEATDSRTAICPIVYWSDEQLWEFIRSYNVPYCKLYDEGATRLGCVGCPLKGKKEQQEDFARYPKFEQNWKNACRKYWETHHEQVMKNGKLNFASRFKTWEDFWTWWITERVPDVNRDECQSGMVWTNEALEEDITTAMTHSEPPSNTASSDNGLPKEPNTNSPIAPR